MPAGPAAIPTPSGLEPPRLNANLLRAASRQRAAEVLGQVVDESIERARELRQAREVEREEEKREDERRRRRARIEESELAAAKETTERLAAQLRASERRLRTQPEPTPSAAASNEKAADRNAIEADRVEATIRRLALDQRALRPDLTA